MLQDSIYELLSVTNKAVKDLEICNSQLLTRNCETCCMSTAISYLHSESTCEKNAENTCSVALNVCSGLGKPKLSNTNADLIDEADNSIMTGDFHTQPIALRKKFLMKSFRSAASHCQPKERNNHFNVEYHKETNEIDCSKSINVQPFVLRKMLENHACLDVEYRGKKPVVISSNGSMNQICDKDGRDAIYDNGKVFKYCTEMSGNNLKSVLCKNKSAVSGTCKDIQQRRLCNEGNVKEYIVEKHNAIMNPRMSYVSSFALAQAVDEKESIFSSVQHSSDNFHIAIPAESSDKNNSFESLEKNCFPANGNADKAEMITVPESIGNMCSKALILSDFEETALQDSGSSGNQTKCINTVTVEKCEGSTFDTASITSLGASIFAQPSIQISKSAGLCQGTLAEDIMTSKSHEYNDVKISKFFLTEKQIQLKKALSMRGSKNCPVKRVVQPQVVRTGMCDLSGRDCDKNNNMNRETDGHAPAVIDAHVESITAAVAASAAVAATHPFLKMQYDLETKMASILEEMERMQKAVSVTGGDKTAVDIAVTDPGSIARLDQLEGQVKELTERRLQHLETLQSQQMETQAHLLSISRNMASRHRSPAGSVCARHVTTQSSLRPPAGKSRTVVQDTITNCKRYDVDAVNKVERIDNGRFIGPESNNAAVDTPIPRCRPPLPSSYTNEKGHFLREILSADPSPELNTTFRLPTGHTPPTKLLLQDFRLKDNVGPVDKARKLVRDLRHLEERTAESIADNKNKSRSHPDHCLAEVEPAPLDRYLKRVIDPSMTPYTKPGQRHRGRCDTKGGKHQAAGSGVVPENGAECCQSSAIGHDQYGEARRVLQNVVSQRETLEKNMEMIMHAHQAVDASAIFSTGAGDSRSEMSRIRRMVAKKISSLKDKVKIEIDNGRTVAPDEGRQNTSVSKPPSKIGSNRALIGFGSRAPRMVHSDRGTGKSQLRGVDDVLNVSPRLFKARPAPKHRGISWQKKNGGTVATGCQVDGWGIWQRGQSAVAHPWSQQREAGHASAFPCTSVAGNSGIEKRFTKSQAQPRTSSHIAADQGRASCRYYFSATHGYIPLMTAINGHSVPTAMPLGVSRMEEAGRAVAEERNVPTSPPGVTSSLQPDITTAASATFVAMPTGTDCRLDCAKLPVLVTETLPSVDIDGCLSPDTCSHGDLIPITDCTESPLNVSHQGFKDEDGRDDEEGDGNITLTADVEEERQGTGIAFTGQCAAGCGSRVGSENVQIRSILPDNSTAQLRQEGNVPWENKCDQLAEELRKRDRILAKVNGWVKQEVLTRLAAMLFPVNTTSDDKQMELSSGASSMDRDYSTSVGDIIGHQGLQLFMDAGHPVDDKLVISLAREVMAEKVESMMGRRLTDSRTDAAYGVVSEKDVPNEVAGVDVATQPSPLATPSPSGVFPDLADCDSASTFPNRPPVAERRTAHVGVALETSTPPTVHSVATSAMPIADPRQAHSGNDADSDTSTSMDISAELRLLEEKGKVVDMPVASWSGCQVDIATPSVTPPFQENVIDITPVNQSPPTPPSISPQHGVDPKQSPIPHPPSPKHVSSNGKFQQPCLSEYPCAEIVEKLTSESVACGKASVATDMDRSASERCPLPFAHRDAVVQNQSETTDTESVRSTATDTTDNDDISEGQWLISSSEGQVPDHTAPLDECFLATTLACRKADLSAASTMKGLEDLDIEADGSDVSRSEGELLLPKEGRLKKGERTSEFVLGVDLQRKQTSVQRQSSVCCPLVESANLSSGEVIVNGRCSVYSPAEDVGDELESGKRWEDGSCRLNGAFRRVTPKVMIHPLPRSSERSFHMDDRRTFCIPEFSDLRHSDTLTPLVTDTGVIEVIDANRGSPIINRHGITRKSVEFDLSEEATGNLHASNREHLQSSLPASERLLGTERSLGVDYSNKFAAECEAVFSPIKMSVTIPTADVTSGSDVSEMDLRDDESAV